MFLPTDLTQIALADPQAVYALLFGRAVEKQPQVYAMSATFQTGALDEHIDCKIDPQFCNDFLIVEARYQARLNPLRFNDPALGAAINVQAWQSANNVAKNPWVDVLFTSEGGYTCPKYFFSSKPVPIELVCKHADTVTSSWGNFPFGFIAGATSTIKADLYLRRPMVNNVPPTESGNEVPFQICISFIGMDLGCARHLIPMEIAINALMVAGILPADFTLDLQAATTKTG